MEKDLISVGDLLGNAIMAMFSILLPFAEFAICSLAIMVVAKFIGSIMLDRHELNPDKNKFNEMREVFNDTERLLEITKEAKEIEKKHAKVWL